MRIDVASFGPEEGDISLDVNIVPGTAEQRAAVVLLETGYDFVACSSENGKRTTYSRSDSD